MPYAEAVVTTWARAVQDVSLRSEQDMRLHIGATPSMWPLLMDHLTEILDARPELAIQAQSDSQDELRRKLESGALDLVLLADPATGSGVCSEKLGVLTLVLAATQQTSQRQALNENYIYIDWGTAFASWHASKFGEQGSSRMHVDTSAIANAALTRRGGSAFLPESLVSREQGLYRVSNSPSFRRAVYACYRESDERTMLLREIISTLRDVSL